MFQLHISNLDQPRFPYSPDRPMKDYPDITNTIGQVVFSLFEGLMQAQEQDRDNGMVHYIKRRMDPEETFNDLKIPPIPSLDLTTPEEYAVMLGHIVPGSYVKHHVLGQLIAVSGITLPNLGINKPHELFNFGGPQAFPEHLLPQDPTQLQGLKSGYLAGLGQDPFHADLPRTTNPHGIPVIQPFSDTTIPSPSNLSSTKPIPRQTLVHPESKLVHPKLSNHLNNRLKNEPLLKKKSQTIRETLNPIGKVGIVSLTSKIINSQNELYKHQPQITTKEAVARQKSVKTDHTHEFDKQIFIIITRLEAEIKTSGIRKALNQSFVNLLSNSTWDFQAQNGWPGKGKATRYRNKIVSGAYFGNAAYGIVARHIGFSRKDALDAAQVFSLASRFFNADQIYDQESIVSGMDIYDYNNPWYHGVPYLEYYGLQ